MVRDYLDWAAEQVGIARLVAYLLPLIAVVSLAGGVFMYVTKDDGTKGSGGLAAGQATPLPTRPPTQPTVVQPGNLTPLVPPPATSPAPGGTPLPPGTPAPGGTPVPGGTPRPPGSPAPGNTPAPGPTTAPPAGATYTVVSGDTGFGIAGKLNIPAAQQATWIADVARLNDMPNLNSLRVGQVLKIPPTPGAAPATGGAAPAATPRP
jgi:LysM repeat protein